MLWNYISVEFVCAAVGWFLAQFIKSAISVYMTKSLSWRNVVFGSGGMPSSHTSTVVALATAVGIRCGTNSTYFGISLVMAIIVMYDAMNVRRETGEQGKVFNELLPLLIAEGHDLSFDREFKELVGHTPLQVLMGALLGFVTSVVMMACFGML